MPTVTINVSLDKNGNPAVELTDSSGNSDRDQKVTSGDTVKWLKKDNDDKFNITALAPTGPGEAFGIATTGGNGQWLTSVFDSGNSPANTPFPYTLTVYATSAPVGDYDTTEEDENPDNGRPVIRN